MNRSFLLAPCCLLQSILCQWYLTSLLPNDKFRVVVP